LGFDQDWSNHSSYALEALQRQIAIDAVNVSASLFGELI